MIETLLTGEELLSAVHGKQIGTADCMFNDVQTDSRNIIGSKKTLFVPLVGEFQDGHKYIPSVLDKGASVIFLNNSEYESKPDFYENLAENHDDIFFVRVENTLHALQNAAETYVEKKCKNMIRVSITGSSGKTTTKEMLVSVCKSFFGENNVAYTKGNFNSETGLPLSVFKIRGDEKIGIFEMGMNRKNEIGEISKVWKSQYGIITNIGTAHIGILGSQKNIAEEKRKSFDYIPADGAAIVGADDSFSDFCTENVIGKIVKFGKKQEKSGVVFVEDKGLFGSVCTVDGETVRIPLPGEYNFLNAASVIACAKEIGISTKAIKEGLENVVAMTGRMEIKEFVLENGRKIMLIKDCYNANLDSMLKVISFCVSLKNIENRIFVLADMKELGAESRKAHEDIGRKLNSIDVQKVILIGEEMKAAYDVLENKSSALWLEKSSEENFKKAAELFRNSATDDCVLLLKGSHSMELEKLVPFLNKSWCE